MKEYTPEERDFHKDCPDFGSCILWIEGIELGCRGTGYIPYDNSDTRDSCPPSRWSSGRGAHRPPTTF
jgi:hypothetical protein